MKWSLLPAVLCLALLAACTPEVVSDRSLEPAAVDLAAAEVTPEPTETPPVEPTVEPTPTTIPTIPPATALPYPTPTTPPSGPPGRGLRIYSSRDCFNPPFAPTSGLTTHEPWMAVPPTPGGRLPLWNSADGFEEIFSLERGDPFTVFQEPVCLAYIDDTGREVFRRRWQVSLMYLGIEGWIEEYVGSAARPVYTVQLINQPPPPRIETFQVRPEQPRIDEPVTLTYRVRFATGLTLTGGGLPDPNNTPIAGLTMPADSLLLDARGCTVFTLTATNPGNMPVVREIPLCVDRNPPLWVKSLRVSPNPIVGQGPVTVTVSWEIPGFDPAQDRAVLTWHEGGIQAGSWLLPVGSGFDFVPVQIALPGTMLFRIDVTRAGRTFSREAIIPTRLACDTPRMTADPTLPPDCPATPPEKAPATIQLFERGVMLWRFVSGETRPLVILFADGEAYAPQISTYAGQKGAAGEAAPAGLAPPAEDFAYVWESHPGVRDRLGWALGPAEYYETTWQNIAGHLIFKMPFGQNWRYLITDGDWGMWVPILADG